MSPTRSCSPLVGPPSTRRRGQAGFTLTELMVALSGGLFLCIMVFSLSRDVSRFYQRETRVAGATLGSVSGFERLAGELALAGHLSTANIEADPRVCNRPNAAWPQPMRRLRAIQIGNNATVIAGTEVAPGGADTKPQTVTIAGAINVPEVFTTRTVAPNGNGTWQIYLDLGTASARRAGLTALNTAAAATSNAQVMSTLFMSGSAGRILRLRRGGQDQYVLVGSVGTNPGEAFINLAATPTLQRTQSGGSQCGVSDLGEQMAVSVINIVRYELRPLVNDPAYAPLFAASGVGKVPYEDGRVELVRVEVDPTSGQDIAATRELVAEYAVDLKLTPWRATAAANPALIQEVNALDDQSAVTQLVRGVHVRLSLRSREPDRAVDVYGGSTPDNLFRIPLGPAKAPPFARVRSLQADVALRNLENSNW